MTTRQAYLRAVAVCDVAAVVACGRGGGRYLARQPMVARAARNRPQARWEQGLVAEGLCRVSPSHGAASTDSTRCRSCNAARAAAAADARAIRGEQPGLVGLEIHEQRDGSQRVEEGDEMKVTIVEIPGAVYEYVAKGGDGSTLGTYGTLDKACAAWPGAEVLRDPGTDPRNLNEVSDGNRRIVHRRGPA